MSKIKGVLMKILFLGLIVAIGPVALAQNANPPAFRKIFKIYKSKSPINHAAALAFAGPNTDTATTELAEASLKEVSKQYVSQTYGLDAFHTVLYEFGNNFGAEWYADRKAVVQRALTELAKIDPAVLSPDSQVTYAMLKEQLDTKLSGFEFPDEMLSLDLLGEYMDLADPAVSSFPFNDFDYYLDFILRADGFPAFIGRQIEVLKKGMAMGITMNQGLAKKMIMKYEKALEPDPEKNLFYKPLMVMPADIPADKKAALIYGFTKMIEEKIVPSLAKFDSFFRNEYLPACRQTYGLAAIDKDGKWYRQRILEFTGLKDRTAQQIHADGLQEVETIKKKMMDVASSKLEFKGTFKDLLNSLNNNSAYYFNSFKDTIAALEVVPDFPCPLTRVIADAGKDMYDALYGNRQNRSKDSGAHKGFGGVQSQSRALA